MSAPAGNKFWLLRSSHGRKPIFATPQDLWEAACEYFEWVEQNPLLEDRVFSTKDDGVVHEPVSKMRAMTQDGLLLFLDIGVRTWFDYKERKDYARICETIDSVIRSQKFSGAAAGLLNPVIIARDLGLVDKVDGAVTLNKGSGWDEVFAEVGNQSRALTKKEPVVIEYKAEKISALSKLNWTANLIKDTTMELLRMAYLQARAAAIGAAIGLAFVLLALSPIAHAGNGIVVEKQAITRVLATSGNVANAAAAASIPAVAGKLAYITGFSVTGTGATAGQVSVITVTGLAGGTITFTATSVTGALLANPQFNYEFPQPMPASAINTAIQVSQAALGAGSTNNVTNVFGYYE